MQYELHNIKCRRINHTATLSRAPSTNTKAGSLTARFLGDQEDWTWRSAAEWKIS